LINDFRSIQGTTVQVTGKPTSVVSTQILFPNFVKSATITTTSGGVTISPSTITSEQYVDITTVTDTNVYYGRITEDGNIRVTETFSNRITEQGYNTIIPIEVEYTFEDGTTEAAKKAAQLKDAIGDAKALTDAFNPDAKFNALGGALQGVAGGFSAVQGAMGLVGVESKDVEATLLKVQSAMALSEGLNSVMAAKDSFTNLAAVIGKTAIGQKLLTAAQIAGAAAMRVLNVVMAANPIMLIVTGVTALVGAFYMLTRSTDKEAIAQRELNREHELQIKLMKQSQAEVDKYVTSLQKSTNNKIALRKAEGASSEELYQMEKERLEEQIRYVKLMHDSGAKLTAKQYEEQKQAKYDLKILEAQHETDLKNIRDKAEADRRLKAEENRKKRIEEKNALNLEDTKAELTFLEEANKRRLSTEESEKQKQLDTANAKKKIASDYMDFIRASNKKLTEDELKEEEEKEAKKKLLRDRQVQGVQDSLSIISNLTELFAGKSKAQQERAFKIQKAINIASAVIDTYKAANMALASSPPPFSFIAAGAAITAGLLNVKKIASQQFQGGTASSGGGGSFSGGGSMASSGGGTASNVITPNFNIVGNNGQNQLGQIAPVQAYVVSSEMTTQQALDRNRLRNATF
jgi:uncharacterized membrane protein YgcG